MSFDDFITQLAEAMSAQQAEQQRSPTNPDVINKLPLVKINEKHCKKKENGDLEFPTCSVCITDFEMGTESLFLPCGHQFHKDCIKPWLKDHNTCPVCRK